MYIKITNIYYKKNNVFLYYSYKELKKNELKI